MEFLCEPVGGEAEGFHELREEDFAGVDGEGVRDLVHSLKESRSPRATGSNPSGKMVSES